MSSDVPINEQIAVVLVAAGNTSWESARKALTAAAETLRRAQEVKLCAKPSLDCPNMKLRKDDKDWSGDNYDCAMCGGHIWLDYEEMR